MPLQIKLVYAGLLAFCVAHDIGTTISANKAARLYIKGHEANEEIIAGHQAQIEYLCSMLAEHGIEADEFDLIALHFNNE